MLTEWCADFKLDGLGDQPRRKPKNFQVCNVWRDPDLNRNERLRRSFPNKMKAFLCELRGEDRLFLGPSVNTVKRYTLGPKPSKASTISQVRVEYTTPERISRAYKDVLRMNNRGVCLTDQDPAVVRCEKCDYPSEPHKRRSPPHIFTPILTYSTETRTRLKKKSSSVKPLTTYLNLYGVKDNKIQRVKRRRSSTEFYKSMVSVS